MILKIFPSDEVNRDSEGALQVEILYSGPLLALCSRQGSLEAPPMAPGPSALVPPGDTLGLLSSPTQAGVQHLLRTFC